MVQNILDASVRSNGAFLSVYIYIYNIFIYIYIYMCVCVQVRRGQA